MTTRRGSVRFLVLVLAALAVAGTSASPPPPPLATATGSGALEVTTERPIASVVVHLEANEAARAIVGSVVAIRVGAGQAANGGRAIQGGPTIVIVEPVDDRVSAVSGTEVDVSGLLADPCPEFQTCSGTYRISAVLIDPDVKHASVSWHASIALQSNGQGRALAPPPDARLSVRADDPETRPASELSLATLLPETVHLDADHPGIRRTIELERPPTATGIGADGGWLAFITVVDAGDADRALNRIVVDAGIGSEMRPGRFAQFLEACTDPAACRTTLRLELDAPPGDLDAARDVTWSVASIAFGRPGAGPPGPLAARLTARSDPGPDSPRLRATTTGSFDVVKGSSGIALPMVVLDARQANQGAPIGGLIQVRLTGRATAAPGAGHLNLGLGESNTPGSVPIVSGQVAPGATTTIVSRIVPVSCAAMACRLFAPIFAIAPDAGPAVHVDWTVDASWIEADGHPVPDGLELGFEMSSAPPSP